MTTSAALWLLLALALSGHVATWLWVDNRLEALGWHRWLLKTVVTAVRFLFLLAAVASGWTALATPPAAWPWPVTAHLWLAALVAVGPLPWRIWRQATARPPAALRSWRTASIDVSKRLGRDLAGSWSSRLLLGLPGNECLGIDVEDKVLALPRLDPALDGLVVAHLSDLHFSGKIAPEFFHEAVRLVNAMEPDLIAITGDLVDRVACLAWVPEVLGRLRSRLGTYYVLGNHDRRVDVPRLRRLLAHSGVTPLAGRWQRLEVNGQPILLAGNERPWFPRASDPAEVPQWADDDRPLAILLAHTPDQFAWARRHGFDLVLAGHTHGGQVRFPLLGPIVAPSRHGVRYACGTFYEDPTVMHVSRGLSGLDLLRFRCPPELTRLVLTAVPTNASSGETLASQASVR